MRTPVTSPGACAVTAVTTETAWQNLFGRNMFIRPAEFNPALVDRMRGGKDEE